MKSSSLQAMQSAAMIVHLSKGQAVTDSLAIAREFGRRHDNVLQSIDALIEDGTINALEFKAVKYRDGKGEQRRMIELSERGALIAMPFIGGKKSKQGQVLLVDAFLKMRNEINGAAPWNQLRESAANSYTLMSETLQETRSEDGKKTDGYHYSNEAKMINRLLFDVTGSVSRESLSVQDLQLLDKVEIKNAALIGMGLPFKERKQQLQVYADTTRAKIAGKHQARLH
jgi:Rha family phage regulatory protein